MVSFNLAYTAPINREGQSVITWPQAWAGLVRKVNHAEEFVPLITSCEVLSDEPAKSEADVHTITRIVKFKEGNGPNKASGAPVKEVVKLYPNVRVDFLQEDGSKIANYISKGPVEDPKDIFMTYVFEWRHPEITAGSDEAKKVEEVHKQTARTAVESTIETIRKLVSEGKL
jgi:hypothetical protein